MNPKLILAVALALLLLVSAPAQGADPDASFTFAPEAPAPGEPVQLEATTPGGASHTWDLDDDGAFDDAEGGRAKRAFGAGAHVVRLRARFTSGGESIAARTIQVGTPPTPTPTETPAATPTPEPTVTAAPSVNQPPVARIATGCVPGGVCSGLSAREEQPHTLDGTPSHDPDGSIVRYEWTVDGTTLEAGSKLTHTFTRHKIIDDGKRTVRLKVTDDAGATAEDTITLRLLEPECESTVVTGRLRATGICLRKRKQRWTSKDAIVVNGITITPMTGRTVTVASDRLSSTGASVTFTAQGAPVTLLDGTFSWGLADGVHFTNVKPTGRLNGLAITGATAELNADKTSSKVGLRVALPTQFGGPTSDQPIVLTPGKATAAASEPLHFSVRDAKIGPIGLDHLDVAFDGEDLWTISAGVALPEPIAARIDGDAGIRDGGFEHAGASLTFPSPGIGPLGPVFLQRIAFRVELHPKRSKCVPKTGIETLDQRQLLHDITGRWFDVPNLQIDHGIPTFALCGEVGLTAGPTVLGAAAIRLDAGLGIATYDDRPTVFRAFGNVKLVEIPLAEAALELHTNGYTRMHAKFDWGIDDLATLKGGLQFEMLAPKFNATAYVDACLEFVDWCAGAKALVSSKGVAVCLKIDLLVDDWHPGFGYRWGEVLPTLYFAGCDVGPYKEHIRSGIEEHVKAVPASLQSTEQTIDFPAGLPGATIVAQGQGAPPKLTLIGPKGERVTTPDDLAPVEQAPFLILKDPRADLTQFAISKPSAGRWRVVVEPGSAPVTSLKSAEGLKPPAVEAKVGGRGQNRTLTYQTDQRVTFVERGASTGNTLGTANGKGVLRFHPAAGAAEKRTIVALVEGRGEYEVARYTAPAAARPAKTRGLKVTHRGSRVRIAWRDKGAHEATIRLADGRRLVRHTRKRSLTVTGVERATTGTVSVKAVLDSGVNGAPARARVGRAG